MASYEIEHSVPSSSDSSNSTRRPHPRNLDLSTFYSLLESQEPSFSSNNDDATSASSPATSQQRSRAGAIPVPGDVSASYRSLAEAFRLLQREHEGTVGSTDANTQTQTQESMPAAAGDGGGGFGGILIGGEGIDGLQLLGEDTLSNMIRALVEGAERPPDDIRGVSEKFLVDLDRVPKSRLKPDMTCPICTDRFLDDEFPLVVRLPCGSSSKGNRGATNHVFDLGCVGPWLRLTGTCPLDRKDFGKEERERTKQREEEIRRLQEDDDEGEWDGLYG